MPVELLRELDVEGIRQAVNLPAMKWSSEDVHLDPNCPLESPGDEAGESKPRGTQSTHGVLRLGIAFEEGGELLGVHSER